MDAQSTPGTPATSETWPALPYGDWKDTCETLHMYTQIVGKVKLELCPFLNQWWEVALHVSARGLTSGPIPWRDRTFDVEFDFVDHRVHIRVSDGSARTIALESRTVADFYRLFMEALQSLHIEVAITTMPSEVAGAVPFDRDTVHGTYDGAYARRWWQILLATERVMNRFRTPFHGKSSPVNLFWGGFDLNHSRFNGEDAATDPTADRMMRYGENEANFSTGFWPGNEQAPAAFYAYMMPAPAGVETASIKPEGAQFVPAMGEFFLPYETARQSLSPEDAILAFFQSTYEACADLAGWNRAALEGNVPQLRRAK
ncbi:MAG: DUF5996 family protein [Chloroflexota bacterium]